MKKIKFLMVVCLLGIASTVSAQFVNTSNSSSSSMNSSSDATAWAGLRVSYHPVSIEDLNLNGASIGYVKSFGISNGTPIFIETGANISWFGGKVGNEPEDYEEIKLNMFSINVPVNLGYKFTIGENANIFPFIGITLRGNIVGNYSCDGNTTNAFGDNAKLYFFDDDGYYDDSYYIDMQLKRFQIGWQIGVGANFNKFFIGASYGKDFSEILEGSKVSMPSLTIGFNM